MSFLSFTNAHCPPPAATTMTIDLVCPQCGITKKSGKISCCGRGGSWFGNCGAAGTAKLRYKWSDGIQACKAQSQSKVVIGQELHGAQDEGGRSSDDTDESQSRASIAAPNATIISAHTNMSMPAPTVPPVNASITTVARTFMTTTPTDVSMAVPVHSSASTSVTAQRCGQLCIWCIAFHVEFLLMTVSKCQFA